MRNLSERTSDRITGNVGTYFGYLRSTFILYQKSSDDIVNEYNKCNSPTKHLDALSGRLSLLFITPSVILKTLEVVTRDLNNIA